MSSFLEDNWSLFDGDLWNISTIPSDVKNGDNHQHIFDNEDNLDDEWFEQDIFDFLHEPIGASPLFEKLPITASPDVPTNIDLNSIPDSPEVSPDINESPYSPITDEYVNDNYDLETMSDILSETMFTANSDTSLHSSNSGHFDDYVHKRSSRVSKSAKRLVSANVDCDNPVSVSDIQASTRKRTKIKSSSQLTEKKLRKQQQNRDAAIRYRQKKRAECETIFGEEARLELRNKELKNQAEQIKREIDYLKQLVLDVYKAKGVTPPRQIVVSMCSDNTVKL